MKKQPEITENTKRILKSVFWELYCQKEINKITIKEITEQAGFNRSTFYHYFTDIYDLLNEIEDTLIESIVENLKAGLPMITENDFIKRFAHVYNSKGEQLSVLLGQNGNPRFTTKLKNAIRDLDIFIVEGNEKYTEVVFEFAVSGILAAVTSWYKQGKTITAEEAATLVRSMLMKGVFSVNSKVSRCV